jgi:hypothetical protein
VDKDRTRGERRDQARRHIRRARRIEHFVRHGPRRRTCDCDRSGAAGRFRKARAFSCRCISKRKGSPKVAGSLHKSGDKYRQPAMRRIRNKRLARAWQDAVDAGDPDDIVLPSGPIIGRRRSVPSW